MSKAKKEIIKTLELQKEIFGDVLFEKLSTTVSSRKTEVIKEVIMPAKVIPSSKEIIPAKEVITAKVLNNDFLNTSTLAELNEAICNCLNCSLGKTRNKFVFGSGNINADVLVIGEGPGKDEDEQGLPFVGRAGKLLTDILAAIKFSRDDVYIANIVKCRPPGNRVPLPEEMDACIPYLKKQIELIQPKLILCLGLTAAQGLLKKRDTLGNLRGKVFDFENRKVIVTYHPAALLRNPAWKKDCWEDVKTFRRLYEEIVPNASVAVL